MNGVWDIACTRALGSSLPFEALEESTTVTAPMIAMITPRTSRCNDDEYRLTCKSSESPSESVRLGSVEKTDS